MGRVRIGTSGWSYESWRGEFYPRGLPHRRELEYMSRRFDSIEINGSFYSLLTPETYGSWYRETPRGFRFAVKGSGFITHNKKLKDVGTALANFFASGVLLLEDKLGPILWQLPKNMRFDEERLKRFLDLLPRNSGEASRLAKRHDERVKGSERVWAASNVHHRLRYALEVRSESFLTPRLARIARDSGTALVFSDSADWPATGEITAGFVYVRLHGSRATYESGYRDSELDRWASRIRDWRSGNMPADARRITDWRPPRRKSREVYVYFDNDEGGKAPRDALRLARRLELER
jgi:uncharacterized protein YecE (DUF72 family)